MAFSRFIALYYFASAKLSSRKQIFALIQSLQTQLQSDEADLNGPIVSAMRSVIMNDIFSIGGQPCIEIDMAWHQRALTLYTTLDYAMGRAAIHADMDVILDQLSLLLHTRVETTNVDVSRSLIA